MTAKGGQAPAFDVETGSVKVGTKETTVTVPRSKDKTSGAKTRPQPATQRRA